MTVKPMPDGYHSITPCGRFRLDTHSFGFLVISVLAEIPKDAATQASKA